MISASFDFRQFLGAVRHKNHQDIICLAEKEATEAWLHTSHNNQILNDFAIQCLTYQKRLLALVDYLLSGIKSKSLEEEDLKSIPLKDQMKMRN